MKPVTLSSENGIWPAEVLRPVTLTAYRLRWSFWVLSGTVLCGWNMVFLTKRDAEMLVLEGALAEVEEGDDGPSRFLTTIDELSSVVTETGEELFFGWMWLTGVSYMNPSDNPDGSDFGLKS